MRKGKFVVKFVRGSFMGTPMQREQGS